MQASYVTMSSSCSSTDQNSFFFLAWESPSIREKYLEYIQKHFGATFHPWSTLGVCAILFQKMTTTIVVCEPTCTRRIPPLEILSVPPMKKNDRLDLVEMELQFNVRAWLEKAEVLVYGVPLVGASTIFVLFLWTSTH